MTKEINNGELYAAELAQVTGGEGILIQGHCHGPEIKGDSPCHSGKTSRCGSLFPAKRWSRGRV